MRDTDESTPLAVGGGSPADPDHGTRGRTPARGQPPAPDEVADHEPGLDPSASTPDDVVEAVVDFVDLFVEGGVDHDDDTSR